MVYFKKLAWVSFRVTDRRYFDLYSHSIKYFKVNYLCIVVVNTAAKKRICDYENWEIVREKFPLFWPKNHYSLHAQEYVVHLEDLDAEDKYYLDLLKELVTSTPKGLINTKALIEQRRQKTFKRLGVGI